MKNRLIYILLIVLTFNACQDPDEFLDVIPTGTVIPKTLEDFDKLLQNYAILRQVGENVKYMDPDAWHDQTTYATISNNNIYVNASNWKHDLFNPDQSDNDYNNFYFYIHTMNQILQDVDGAVAGGFNEANRNYIKADAFAQRAMEYFMVVNQYAPHYDPSNPDLPGVPMPLKIDLQAQLGRSTVGEVYEQIISDATRALELYGNSYQVRNDYANFRPGRASVNALLAEVYLYMGNFELAVDYSNRALSQYDFLYDYNTVDFLSSSDSGKWTTGYDNSQQWYYGTLNREILLNRYMNFAYLPGIQLISPDLVDLFDKDNDRRWYLFTNQVTRTGVDVSPNYIYMRAYSEVCNGLSTPRLLLTNAEARARTGDGSGAINQINKLLENRLENFVPLTFTDNATALQIVKDERRKELVGTSLNLYDQKRYHVYGDNVPTYTRINPVTGETFTLEPGSEGYWVEIAQSVKNQNPNLN